ncbi:transcriptional regulator TyrR [Paraneptunicella aestuarii]|uniref:transcriptional regulator TyrR n=1 Tax=Paraneptunicella aestuarii TaxID=2831148 RepID=UPI001E2CC195|nr:transcriptional regulator TyrR [Paraneptunicella aestuarii]UAA37784.1 transcriptional regulator TyrR [Paraneptunicella aestuarii]
MRLEISCQDRLGIAQDVLDILVRHNIDLRGIEVDRSGKIYLNFPNIEFEEFQHLMPEIRKLSGVDDVKTIPFMPIEREKKQLRALLEILPDPVFSVDTKGKVLLVNEAASSSLEQEDEELRDKEIGDIVKGFNFNKWLGSKKIAMETHRVKFVEQDYVADMLPILVAESSESQVLAGAVIMLKSEYRLGQQLHVFHQSQEDGFTHIQANSTSMKRVIREAKKMSELDAPILIFGETGTGKELIAKACHHASRRDEAPFLALNCAAIPDNVAETELFGYGPGAFGGQETKSGLFEQAKGGTLFLDEVGDMSPHLQSKLLRVLQDGSFRRIGDEKEVETDVRVICATQKDLGQMVADGEFREDLYYRLNVLSLVLPALRERKQDIIPLAEVIIKQHSAKLGRRPPKLNKSCVDFLTNYPWPGNIRQLENALYRAVSLLDGKELSKEHIQLPSCAGTINYISEDFEGTLEHEVKRFERDLLRRMYPSYPSTRQLAKKLGLSHTAIANKLREYGINRKTVKV